MQSPSAQDGLSPGEFVLKKLFAEFAVRSDSKLKFIATQRQVRNTSPRCLSGVVVSVHIDIFLLE